MKTRILFAAVTILFAVSFTQGAHLTHYDGGVWGQVDRDINDSNMIIPSSPNANGGSTYCQASITGSTEYSYAQGSMLGEVASASYWGEDLGTAVTNDGYAVCSSSDSTAKVWSYGNAATVVPAYTDGIFFVIEADEGENTGDPVQVQWHWSAACTTFYGDAQSSVSGGGTIYLTRNVMPPTGMPETGIMWSRDGVTFTEPDSAEDGGSFNAEIGDVIGVFFNANAGANLEGEGSSGADVSTTMELLATAVPPELIEYSYAPGLVYDADQNITFLKDWSAAGESLNWADANTWAENFTYDSNGITYSNWRLPRTIDDQGAAVGEFGYLYTHYGIDVYNQGPFVNIYGGDYWTAPQFSRAPDPNIVYAFTFDTFFGPAQWWSSLDYECRVIPVFDGPPAVSPPQWCPADFNNDGIVDFKDLAVFASYWLNERP